MTPRWPLLAACVALGALGSPLACSTEVTIHLLKASATAPSGGTAGTAGTSSAGEGGAAGAVEAAAAGADAGGTGGSTTLPPEPCQKLGSEVCNGGDDDCNGVMDDGCSVTVVWSRDPEGVVLGHVTGGVNFFEPCPDGAVLTGLEVGMGNWLNQVSAICRQIAVNVDSTPSSTTSSSAFSVVLGPRFDTPLAPAASTDMKNKVEDLICPDGSVLIGVDGTMNDDTAHYIYGIRITCALPIVAMPARDPVFDTDRSQTQTAGPIVCVGCMATQAYNFTTSIPAGHIATSLFGGDGLWVDRVGFGSSIATITSR